MKKMFFTICLTAVLALVIRMPARAVSSEEAAWQKVVEAAKKEGVINFYSITLIGKAGVEVMKAFKAKYGITLELVAGKGSQLAEKIRMEQRSKSYVADLFEGTGATYAILKREGLLQSVARGLPAIKEGMEKSKFSTSPTEDAEGEVMVGTQVLNGFYYNTNLVKPGEVPKSWYDLLDPKWKGKIYLLNPLYGTGIELHVVAFDKILGMDYYKKLFKQGKVAGPSGGREVKDKVARSEVAIAGPSVVTTLIPDMVAGAPVRPLDLKEGNLMRTNNFLATKNGPHPNATKVFLNWVYSREGHLVYTKALGLDGIRNDIPSAAPDFLRLKGPSIYMTFKQVEEAEARASTGATAKELGIKD